MTGMGMAHANTELVPSVAIFLFGFSMDQIKLVAMNLILKAGLHMICLNVICCIKLGTHGDT